MTPAESPSLHATTSSRSVPDVEEAIARVVACTELPRSKGEKRTTKWKILLARMLGLILPIRGMHPVVANTRASDFLVLILFPLQI